MKITFIRHSSFLVETDLYYYLFDYYKGAVPSLDKEKKLYIFASHVHHDHYDPAIFRIGQDHGNTRYILSDDIRKEFQESGFTDEEKILWTCPDHEYVPAPDLRIRTFPSTDEGVAFLLSETGEDGVTRNLYHAGDLHWWNWKGEDPEWLSQVEKQYKQQIDLLSDTPLDAAFAVLDPRLEENSMQGLEYLLERCRIRHLFPMHSWGSELISSRFEKTHQKLLAGTQIHHPGPEKTWTV